MIIKNLKTQLSGLAGKFLYRGLFVCECENQDVYPEGFALFWHNFAHEIFLEKCYWPAVSFVRRNIEYTRRALRWFKFSYHNHDFDSSYLYSVLAFKARSLLKSLQNGHVIQEPEDLAALKEFILVCDRLHLGEYEDRHHDDHSAKWGERTPSWSSTPHSYYTNGKPKTYSLNFPKRPNVKTPEDEKQEIEDLLAIHDKGEVDRIADIDRMAEILKKHAHSWWD